MALEENLEWNKMVCLLLICFFSSSRKEGEMLLKLE